MAAWGPRPFLLGAYPWYALGILLTAVVWELAAMALGPYRLPSLETVASQFFPLLTSSKTLEFQGGGSQGYWPHLLHTMAFTLFSSLTGVVTGVAFGLAMARFKPIRAISEVPIELLRGYPRLQPSHLF